MAYPDDLIKEWTKNYHISYKEIDKLRAILTMPGMQELVEQGICTQQHILFEDSKNDFETVAYRDVHSFAMITPAQAQEIVKICQEQDLVNNADLKLDIQVKSTQMGSWLEIGTAENNNPESGGPLIEPIGNAYAPGD